MTASAIRLRLDAVEREIEVEFAGIIAQLDETVAPLMAERVLRFGAANSAPLQEARQEDDVQGALPASMVDQPERTVSVTGKAAGASGKPVGRPLRPDHGASSRLRDVVRAALMPVDQTEARTYAKAKPAKPMAKAFKVKGSKPHGEQACVPAFLAKARSGALAASQAKAAAVPASSEDGHSRRLAAAGAKIMAMLRDGPLKSPKLHGAMTDLGFTDEEWRASRDALLKSNAIQCDTWTGVYKITAP